MKNTALLLVCGAVALLAADPWKEKKATEWTEKDAGKVLTNSPWARSAAVEINEGGRGGGGTGMPSGSGRRGGGGGGGGNQAGSGGLIGSGDGPTGGGSGMDSPGGGAPSGPQVTVRWESAAPAIDAFARMEYTLLPKLKEWSTQYYVVTALGLPVAGGGGGARQGRPAADGAAAAQPDPTRIMQAVAKATLLKRKGKEPIVPARVELVRMGPAVVPMFLFPRTDAITGEDKDVTFESAAGSIKVKAKFSLKDMLYEGKLAL